MNNETDFDIHFLPVIHSYVKSYQEVKEPFLKKKLKEGLKDTLKKWTDQPVKMVSQSVLEKASQMSPPINPYDLMYTDRKKLGMVESGDKLPKSWLVWEHSTPLNELYQNLVECRSLEEIKDVLSNYSGVCWISRDEDNQLNKNGFRSTRPGGWKECYKQCGINFIYKESL